MKKLVLLLMVTGISLCMLSGCVTAKKMQEAENQNQNLRRDLESSNNHLKKMEVEIGKLKEKGKTREDFNKAELARLKQINTELKKELSDEITKGEISISQIKGKLIINVAERLVFPSGSAELTDNGKKSLGKIGAALNKIPDKIIRVEGHTDDVPIGENLQTMYQSNWELSAFRAVNVVKYLVQEVGVNASRLSAIAFGQYKPVTTNTTEKGRSKNRRIEILVEDTDLERLKMN